MFYSHFFLNLVKSVAMKNFALFLLFILSIHINAQELPLTFDLRSFNGNNYVTSIKHQLGGTCWTHGAMASIEGNLLMNGNWLNAGLDGEPDLSEYHLDWWNGFNYEFNQDTMANDGSGLEVHYGGDYRVTSAYLSRGEGAIKDTTNYSSWYYNAPSRKRGGYKYFYVRDIEWYTMDESLNGIETIKRKVMENGVMGTCMAYSQDFIYQYMHYQPPTNDMDPNHAIAIIGWNDTIDIGAPEPGAWLCKNSWGESWGNDGCFWISYYDKWAGRHPEMGAVSLFNAVEPFYDSIYYHDYHGWRDTKTDITTALNVFTANDTIEINAVSFFTAIDSVHYSYKIYKTFDGVDLTDLIAHVDGFIPHSGFHTIDLLSDVIVNKDENFYLYLELDKGGHPFDRTSEVPVLLCGDNTRAIVRSTSKPGQSFYKNESDEWIDFYNEGELDWVHTGNFCMKALVTNKSESGVGISSTAAKVELKVYPQPADVELNFRLQNNTQFTGVVSIVNISGQVIYESAANAANQLLINTKDWDAGVYFYMIETSSGIQRGKIIKQ